MALFDRYVVVDWSARNAPATGRDSIWIADLGHGAATELENPATRHLAATSIDRIIDEAGDARLLLAVDVSLGYPSGSARWFGLDVGSPWEAMWETLEREIVDDAKNRSNRFEVAAELNRRGGATAPFWGRHAAKELAGLSSKKPSAFPVPEFRSCEEFLRANGARPSSPWQLLGAGSVGSQTLTMIPILQRLRRRSDAHVWPFTTGLRVPTVAAGGVVICEIWPTVFELELPADRVRDAAQVAGVARSLAAADAAGHLAEWFTPASPGGVIDAVEREEGWILGVGRRRAQG